jgi:protein disulfide-isomerase
MKTLSVTLLLLLYTVSGAVAQVKDSVKKEGGLEWHTDLMKAHELSQSTGKPIFAFFTGSDWCGWCKKLQAHVFAKPEFVEWAKKNVILLELDFPRSKEQSPELKQQNQSLQQAFGIQGYPTIWMFYMQKDPNAAKFNIDAVGSLGYPQGATPGNEQAKFIKDGDELLKKRAVTK